MKIMLDHLLGSLNKVENFLWIEAKKGTSWVLWSTLVSGLRRLRQEVFELGANLDFIIGPPQ